MKHCKKPCSECPYMKKSEPGYFGGNDPGEYQVAIHRDTVVACHTTSTYDHNEDVETAVVCRGHLLAQKKVCKQIRHEEAVDVAQSEAFQEQYDELKDEVLGFDFAEHHRIGMEDYDG